MDLLLTRSSSYLSIFEDKKFYLRNIKDMCLFFNKLYLEH